MDSPTSTKMSIDLNKKMISKRSSHIPQYVATIIVNLCTFTYGSVVGWSSTALPYLQSEESPLQGGPISSEDASWLASLLCLVAVPATPLYTYLCERFGCKLSGYLVGIPFILSWILVIFADSVMILHVSKFIVGISAGGSFIVCSTYVRDIAEDSIRGSLCVFMIIFVNAGLVFAYVIGSFFSYQVVSIISLAVPCVFMAGFFFLPETPIYLLSREKHGEAGKALQWLRGKNADIDDELESIKTTLKSMKADDSTTVSFKDLFTPKSNLRAFAIGIILCFNQQLCGIFGILNYTVAIFKESGSNLSPNASSIIVGVMLFGGTFLSSLLVDRTGRKILLLISDIAMAISLGVLGLYFYLKEQGTDLSSVGWIPVTCLSTFVISIAIGLFPVPYVILAEIFTPKIRGMASSIAIAETWILAFVVAKSFTFICETFGIYVCYWIFAVFCILGAVYIIIEVPETKDRSIESLQQQLQGNYSAKSNKEYVFPSAVVNV